MSGWVAMSHTRLPMCSSSMTPSLRLTASSGCWLATWKTLTITTSEPVMAEATAAIWRAVPATVRWRVQAVCRSRRAWLVCALLRIRRTSEVWPASRFSSRSMTVSGSSGISPANSDSVAVSALGSTAGSSTFTWHPTDGCVSKSTTAAGTPHLRIFRFRSRPAAVGRLGSVSADAAPRVRESGCGPRTARRSAPPVRTRPPRRPSP